MGLGIAQVFDVRWRSLVLHLSYKVLRESDEGAVIENRTSTTETMDLSDNEERGASGNMGEAIVSLLWEERFFYTCN